MTTTWKNLQQCECRNENPGNHKFENFLIFGLNCFQIGFVGFLSSKFISFWFLNAFMHGVCFITLLWQSISSSTIDIYLCIFPLIWLFLFCWGVQRNYWICFFFLNMQLLLFTSCNLYQSNNGDVHFKICELMFERIEKSLERSGFCGCSKLTTKCSGYRIEKILELYS